MRVRAFQVASVIAVLGLGVPTRAVTVISRFDAGLEGWTVEGPGTLEWVVAGGSPGGFIRVTRTGPGEVYLVAPPSYQQADCVTPYPDLCFHVRADRPVTRSQSVVVETTQQTAFLATGFECAGCWFPWHRRVFFNAPFVSITAVKILVGVDPSLPVGEVAEFDNIEWHTMAANCDGSTAVPILNTNDFQCFSNAFAARDPFANFDGSTVAPYVNANDFQAFLSLYASEAGCP